MNENFSIALIAAGVVGLLMFVTGLAMVYEPAALIVLGAAVTGSCLAIAHVRGRAVA